MQSSPIEKFVGVLDMSLVLLFYKYKTFTVKEINKGIYIYNV